MSEHRYDIRISESCVDPNPFMGERQDPDNFTRFQTRKRCALEIAPYVFNTAGLIHMGQYDRTIDLKLKSVRHYLILLDYLIYEHDSL